MADFAPHLAGEVTTIALCWRIARSDGVTLGLTTHDRPLSIDGLHYAAAPGMTPSAISLGDGLDIDTMEIAGAFAADAISASDLAEGRFDGASVSVFMVDWTAPAAATLPLARGTLGGVERRLGAGGGSFTATVRGPTAALDATVIELCSPDCRAELGDPRCGVDLAARTTLARVLSGSTSEVVVVAEADPDRFVNGRLRVLAGPCAGLDARIVGIGGGLVLFEPLLCALAPGTLVALREGCDKRLATCIARFGNAANFRGEPHVPGGDVLTRFPGV